MLLLLAAALPSLLGNEAAPAGCVQAPPPRVNYRPNVATASSSPWIDSNGWRFMRQPHAKFCIDAAGKASGLAAAEAFAYGAAAYIRTGADGKEPFEKMIRFLEELPASDLPPIANVGIVDDGNPRTGELLNLLSRRNLLYRVVEKPDPHLDINVMPDAGVDPNKQTQTIRQQLGDEKRTLRIYGSEVVIGRVTGNDERMRVQLINYSPRPVNGLRVRVLGNFSKSDVHVFGVPGAKLEDFSSDAGATEFTLPSMNEYAVIDLSR